MKKLEALVVLMAMLGALWFCPQANSEIPPHPTGIDNATANDLMSGKIPSAVIRDDTGVAGQELLLGFPWLTQEVSFFDYIVFYRNDTWITQPLPVRHRNVPNRVQTLLTLAEIATGIVVAIFAFNSWICGKLPRQETTNSY